jgi:DNA-binding MarR family transcriptional regulator
MSDKPTRGTSERDAKAPSEFQNLVGVDKTIHEPARLAILTALSACASADYVFLQRLTGLVSGSLTQHLARLEEAGLVTITKGFSGKYPQTTVTLTDGGRAAIEAHWERMSAVREAAIRWRTAEQE